MDEVINSIAPHFRLPPFAKDAKDGAPTTELSSKDFSEKDVLDMQILIESAA
jgi:hypothetical protein